MYVFNDDDGLVWIQFSNFRKKFVVSLYLSLSSTFVQQLRISVKTFLRVIIGYWILVHFPCLNGPVTRTRVNLLNNIFFGRCDKSHRFPSKRYTVTCQPSSTKWKTIPLLFSHMHRNRKSFFFLPHCTHIVTINFIFSKCFKWFRNRN